MSEIKSLKARIVEHPFGTQTKRELELMLLEFLISESELPKDPAGLARAIRCTLTKAHSYLTDLALRQPPLDEMHAVNQLKQVLNRAEVSRDGMFIEFSVQDAALRLWIEQSLAMHGLLQGQTFRRDLIKLSAKAVVSLVFTYSDTKLEKAYLPQLKEIFGESDWFKEFEKSSKKGVPWSSLLGGMSSAVTILEFIAAVSKYG